MLLWNTNNVFRAQTRTDDGAPDRGFCRRSFCNFRDLSCAILASLNIEDNERASYYRLTVKPVQLVEFRKRKETQSR
jgi:hypothetical protein